MGEEGLNYNGFVCGGKKMPPGSNELHTILAVRPKICSEMWAKANT